MKIGIKYCGGCNPNYNRKKAVEKISKNLTGCSIESVSTDQEYNIILIVCGCHRTCIKDQRPAKSGQYVVLHSEEDFENMEKSIMKERWDFIRYELRDEIALLTISRPEKLNALNYELYQELSEVADFVKETEAKGLIITGDGDKAFVAGADIAEMKDMTGKDAYDFGVICNRAFRKIELLSIPVIAAVNGYALGGGCELALSCHIRICTSQAVFAMPEVSLGVIPGSGGTQRLPRLVKIGMAKELLLGGRMVDAKEALRIGLVSQIVPENLLVDIAWQMLRKRLEERI
ncbi:MAG: enoyl-CoA hydratase-related protein [Hespellia sp.]|nr:enoyl-CoA hydratase-related protein [Hespellia sp.]